MPCFLDNPFFSSSFLHTNILKNFPKCCQSSQTSKMALHFVFRFSWITEAVLRKTNMQLPPRAPTILKLEVYSSKVYFPIAFFCWKIYFVARFYLVLAFLCPTKGRLHFSVVLRPAGEWQLRGALWYYSSLWARVCSMSSGRCWKAIVEDSLSIDRG